MFQYPLADRVGFWGGCAAGAAGCGAVVSVSSCGSSWFLGLLQADGRLDVVPGFSILLRIELVFGGRRSRR